jgi:N-acetylglutamate synthase-like GNAT family acetyltransferase
MFETPYRAQTGYVLAKHAWGRGYATEALGAMTALARQAGVRRLYAVDAAPLREVDRWLEPYRRFWNQKLDALATEVARGKRARRATHTHPEQEGNPT